MKLLQLLPITSRKPDTLLSTTYLSIVEILIRPTLALHHLNEASPVHPGANKEASSKKEAE